MAPKKNSIRWTDDKDSAFLLAIANTYAPAIMSGPEYDNLAMTLEKTSDEFKGKGDALAQHWTKRLRYAYGEFSEKTGKYEFIVPPKEKTKDHDITLVGAHAKHFIKAFVEENGNRVKTAKSSNKTSEVVAGMDGLTEGDEESDEDVIVPKKRKRTGTSNKANPTIIILGSEDEDDV